MTRPTEPSDLKSPSRLKLERAYRILSAFQKTLLRAVCEASFLQEVCRILVEVGEYRLAWIGLAQEDEEKTVLPVAAFGPEIEYLKRVRISWGETEHGIGPTGRAIRSGKPAVAHSIPTDPQFAVWREEAIKRGFTSSSALPLLREGIKGALCVYSREADAFDPEELELLQDLTDNLAYGINFLRASAEKRQAELLMAQQEAELARAREMDRLKDQFFASMTHELRTPLNSIIGFAEDALDGLAGELNSRQRRYVDHILVAGRRLLALINEILDLAKLRSGQVNLQVSSFELAPLAIEVRRLFEPMMARKSQTLEMADFSQLPRIRADRDKVGQILTNLIDNAHKFTPVGGTIVLRAERQGPMLRLMVQDNGVGIPPQDLSAIFEEFKQVDRTPRPINHGTGLGLAITKSLVEKNGGRIDVASEPDRGSTFSFTLPIAGEES